MTASDTPNTNEDTPDAWEDVHSTSEAPPHIAESRKNTSLDVPTNVGVSSAYLGVSEESFFRRSFDVGGFDEHLGVSSFVEGVSSKHRGVSAHDVSRHCFDVGVSSARADVPQNGVFESQEAIWRVFRQSGVSSLVVEVSSAHRVACSAVVGVSTAHRGVSEE